MIRELHVTCLASEIVAPDVGLRLRRGESAWLPADALQQSVVLRGLVQVRAIIVNLEKRYTSLRVPPATKPPRVRPATPSASPVAYTIPPKQPTPTSVPPLRAAREAAPPSTDTSPKKRGRPPKPKPDTEG